MMKVGGSLGKLTRNQGAVVGLIKLIVFLIIVSVVLYSDIQFVIMMSRMFPDGIAKVFSIIGAFATGLSVLALLIAEMYWFVRGKQMLTGWIMTGVEIAISIANLLTSFQLSANHLDSFFAFYLWYVCPATPVIAVIGWILIFTFDEGQLERHEEREMQADMAQMERAHKRAQHEATMQLKDAYLQSTTQYLMEYAASPEVQAQLKAGAALFGAEALSSLTGQFHHPQLKAPQIVDGSVKFADTGELPAVGNQVENGGNQDNQVENGAGGGNHLENLEKIQYTHNKAPTEPWGGPRNGAGRRKKSS